MLGLIPAIVILAVGGCAATGIAGYFGLFAPVKPTPGIEYKDLISILLTAATVVLAAAAIGLAGLAVWGYQQLHSHAGNIAESKAAECAKKFVDDHMGSDEFKRLVIEAANEIIRTRTAERLRKSTSRASSPTSAEQSGTSLSIPDKPRT